MSWQSICVASASIRAATRCVDVCPVGRDYGRSSRTFSDAIAERTPEKEARLA